MDPCLACQEVALRFLWKPHGVGKMCAYRSLQNPTQLDHVLQDVQAREAKPDKFWKG